MKTICAWCQCVIREGPEQPVSHGVCKRCAKRITQAESEKYRDHYSYVADQCFFAVIAVAFFFLIILAVEGLHWFTGGKTPSFLEWKLPREEHQSFRD